jgi:hypothetical protein
MNPYYDNGFFMFYPVFLPPNCQKPPTVYTILESIVNPDVDLNDPAPEVKIKDLAQVGRTIIFNFDYPLTNNVSRETFETMILNHFLQRRIGFETVTAFRIQLDVKLNEIMPIYNKMFDALENWDIFNDGETTVKTGTDNRTTQSTNKTSNTLSNESNTTTTDISDRRNSELPQNQLGDLRDGNYVTNYNYDSNTNTGKDNSTSNGSSEASNNGTDNNVYNETIKRTPADKIAILKEMQENIKSIYSLIFKDLECLFYQLV